MSQKGEESQHRDLRVLIIDDEDSLIHAIARVLQNESIEVFIAQNASDGIKSAYEKCPDVIVLDYYLGDVTAKEVLADLHKMPRTEKIPVIVISAHVDAEREVASIGRDLLFLKKPFNVHDLNAAIAATTAGDNFVQ